MKKIYLFYIFICVYSQVASSQETQNHFKLDVSYGIGKLDFNNVSEPELLPLEVPLYGSFLDISFDLKLPKNRYIGLGFSKQEHSKTLNNLIRVSDNTFIGLGDYRNLYRKLFFDVHFLTEFKYNINLNIGIFYFLNFVNQVDGIRIQNQTLVSFNGIENRSDYFGVFIAPEYIFPIKSYLRLGIEGRVYFSLGGTETIALLPTVQVLF